MFKSAHLGQESQCFREFLRITTLGFLSRVYNLIHGTVLVYLMFWIFFSVHFLVKKRKNCSTATVTSHLIERHVKLKVLSKAGEETLLPLFKFRSGPPGRWEKPSEQHGAEKTWVKWASSSWIREGIF